MTFNKAYPSRKLGKEHIKLFYTFISVFELELVCDQYSHCLLLVPSAIAKSLYVQSQTFEMHYFVLRETDRGLMVAVVLL